MDTRMLIGSRFERGTEHEEKILNPRTGETILNLPELRTTRSGPPGRRSPNGHAPRPASAPAIS